MKIIFFGLNEFGEICLKKLLRHKINVSTVVISDQQRSSDIFKLCKKYNIRLIRYESENETVWQEMNDVTDIVIIASFPKLLPKKLIELPRYGTMNVHPGELPKYRGTHPIQWALIHDEKYIGVTVHHVEEGMDSGPIIGQKRILVSNKDTIDSLTVKLASAGGDLLIPILSKIAKHKKRPVGVPQRISEATFAPKRRPEESSINWQNNSREIFNLIRALKKEYAAYTYTKQGTKVNILKAFVPPQPGKVIAKIGKYYLIATGDGVTLAHTDMKLEIGEILGQ